VGDDVTRTVTVERVGLNNGSFTKTAVEHTIREHRNCGGRMLTEGRILSEHTTRKSAPLLEAVHYPQVM